MPAFSNNDRKSLLFLLAIGNSIAFATWQVLLNNFVVEQAYVTAGILSGEFLIGRFNAPVGLYSVDMNDNVTISFSNRL